ncbi:phospho-N-acetylmuramoyl-pentapeptide-transferase, partial [bacterium]|nr:phospho-N-acetylmuramoyl-pentapeptide-transferase [bacterium]
MLSGLFSAISIRIIFSIFTSFLVAVFIGPGVIENLKSRQIGQNIREEGVQSHKKKAGIPTMGGVIILIPVIITTLLWAKWNIFVGVVLFS